MAFIDIKDPIKREETVRDYIKTIKEIRARSENEKVRGISQRQDIAKVFQPVVQATEKSAKEITSELKNLKAEVKEEPKELRPTHNAAEYFLNNFSKSKLDQYFGIYKEDDVYRMGNKEIVVDDKNNIHVDNGGASFKGTKGLWRLIMYKTPDNFEDKDFEDYEDLLERTNALEMPHITAAANKPKNTAKWRFFKENGIVEGGETDKDDKDGTGIEFLPGDINGLIEQLHLLLAESRAGNKSSTRNQIVAILDQLLKRNYLNQEEYNAIQGQIC